jgi:hypothetical protein
MLISSGTKQQQPQFQQISVCALVYHRAGLLISSLWPMDCDWILHISRRCHKGGVLWYQSAGIQVFRFHEGVFYRFANLYVCATRTERLGFIEMLSHIVPIVHHVGLFGFSVGDVFRFETNVDENTTSDRE